MKARGGWLLIVSFAISVLMLLCVGCNKNDDVTSAGTGPSVVAPTNLRAYSAGATSVGLQWDLSSSESNTSFVGYQVATKKPDGSSAVSPISVLKANRDATVTGLTEGVVYTFVVRSTATGNVVSSDSASVKWSPARRLIADDSLREIKVYEFASANGSSGLQFYNITSNAPETQSLKTSNPDRALADVYLSTDAGGALSLKTMVLSGIQGAKNTFFSDSTYDADNLNFPRVVPPDTNSYIRTLYVVPSTTSSLSKIVFAKSITDNKYVRVLIRKNSSNMLISGSSPDRYITVEISYQNAPGNPYARPTGGDWIAAH